MNDSKRYSARKLELGQISVYIGNLLSTLLGRTITCSTQAEDDNYWCVAAVGDRFSNSEIMELISYVNGDATMIRRNIPLDSNWSRSLDMDLCRALLKQILRLDWEQEFATSDCLWILGHWPESTRLPALDHNLLFVDRKIIDTSNLMAKDALMRRLFDNGGSYSCLVNIEEAYDLESGTPLYWHYPITDGKHNGCYLILVQEGILKLGYDVMDHVDHEVFDPDSAVLCSAEDLACFIDDWSAYSENLTATLNALLHHQERKEVHTNA